MEIDPTRWLNRQVEVFSSVKYLQLGIDRQCAPLKILNTKHHLAVKGEQNLYLSSRQSIFWQQAIPPIWTLVHTKKKGPYVKVRFSVFILMRLILVCPPNSKRSGKARAHIPFQFYVIYFHSLISRQRTLVVVTLVYH